MSYHLWRYFFEDDVESFRRVLAEANLSTNTYNQRSVAGGGVKGASPGGSFSTSPKLNSKNRRTSGWASSASIAFGDRARNEITSLSRSEINRRDNFGRTILHHAASSNRESAAAFVAALLEIPFVDLYVQDLESGWTPLHRALYFGNIAIAHALMARDIRDVTDYTSSGVHHHSGGLIKIKDHEGNSPFDVYGTTISCRRLPHKSKDLEISGDEADGSSVAESSSGDSDHFGRGHAPNVRDPHNLVGDEVFTFGSNKNLNLGHGDQDDRQYPEKITLQRPQRLLQRFCKDWMDKSRRGGAHVRSGSTTSSEEATPPFLALNPPMSVRDVVMSKLHTAVLTNDPECNLFVCGFGPGGRLGAGDESTRFGFVCIDPPCFHQKQVTSVALGLDHSIAITEGGEVFTWGSNKYGQLGYSLPKTNSKSESSLQLLPRQIYGPLKKETIVGAAASSIHSVLFTAASLYTFGKNEGQLGLVDSDARSLGAQIQPRKVAASLFSSAIVQVSAIDRATVCLLECHEVWVFTHFGYAKLLFPLHGFSNYFLRDLTQPKYDESIVNFMTKIGSGGNTICALSNFGEVYTVHVNQAPEPSSTAASTTNPGKIRNSLQHPSRVWSIGKPHMAVTDVDVGQDGSIILCTKAGSVWKKEKRANIKNEAKKGLTDGRARDYKFVRIPSLTKAVAVRSNAFGAYAAVRRDHDVTRTQILTHHQQLWEDMFKLLPFRNLKVADGDSNIEYSPPYVWTPAFVDASPSAVKKALLASSNVETEIKELLNRDVSVGDSSYDTWLKSTSSEVRIPVHEFALSGRSAPLRDALQQFRQNYYFEQAEAFSIEYDKEGQILVQFFNLDFLALVNLVFYIYTDNVVDARFHTGQSQKQITKYKQVRTELMKLASSLEMRNLERSARMMIDPVKCLHTDMEEAVGDFSFFDSGDALIELNGGEVKVHSPLMSIRCLFFNGLFNGRTRGAWISARRDMMLDQSDLVKVDLNHIDPATFNLVLKYLYTDMGETLFDDVAAATLDDFIDIVLDVMAAANELMLDRLSQVCQKVLGNFVNTRNVTSFLNAVAPCSVTEFKDAALEYICLNMEAMLEGRLLDELDGDLFIELDEVVRSNQCAYLGSSRSGEAEAELLSRYPDLVFLIEANLKRRIDSMSLRSRLDQDEERFVYPGQPKFGSLERGSPSMSSSPKSGRKTPKTDETASAASSPVLRTKDSMNDMIFDMDDEQRGHVLSRDRRMSSTSSALEPAGLGDDRRVSSRIAQNEGQSIKISQGDSLAESSPFPLASSPGRDGRSFGLGKSKEKEPLQELPYPETRKPSVPWDSTKFQSVKVDMSEILAQAAATRTSNLSLGVAAKRERRPSENAVTKLSQKERKKLQQQQLQDSKTVPESESTLPLRVTSGGPPKSPWQTPQKGPNTGSKADPSGAATTDQTGPSSTPIRSSSKTRLTMRQTIPGNAFSKSQTPPKTQTAPSSSSKPPSKPSQPTVQSVRHTPFPQPPSSSTALSMADILALQQSEKDNIKEAATSKRSLQDIQQEQEFQEWWDQESAKVRAEQEATAKREQSGRGRGKGRGGRGRGSRGGGFRGGGGQGRVASGEGKGKGKEKMPGASL